MAVGPSRLSGDMLMPVGVLALGWGSRLVLFEVPLLGDQVTAGEAATGGAWSGGRLDGCSIIHLVRQ